MRSLLLLITVLTAATSHATTAKSVYPTPQIEARLREFADRGLTPAARRALEDIAAGRPAPPPISAGVRIKRPYRMTVRTLYCVGLNADVFFSGLPFACVNSTLERFVGMAIGNGIGGGFSGTLFTLLGHVRDDLGLTGNFSGASAGVAWKFLGGTLGWFTRNGENGLIPDGTFDERMWWIGYQAGFVLDISALVVGIRKI